MMAPSAAPGPVESFDRRLFRALYFGTRNKLFNVVMPFISIAANRGVAHGIIGSIMMAFGATTPGGQKLLHAGAALILSTLVAGILAECTVKFIWKRKRPFQVMPDIVTLIPSKRLEHRPSFPSGHSAGYLAAATAVSIYYPQLSFFLVPAGILSAFSRIYNGVHYPSDVLAGMTLGAASAFAVCRSLIPLLPF